MLRPAVAADRADLAAFLTFVPFIHRHLDWRPAVEWLPVPPYWVLEEVGKINAVLACPPDPAGVGWIRLFACSPRLERREVFTELMDRIRNDPAARELDIVSLAMQPWFEDILLSYGFQQLQKIVVLTWLPGTPIKQRPTVHGLQIVPLLPDDLPETLALDNLCFEPIWRFSPDSLRLAYEGSTYATAGIIDGEIVAYQLSNQHPFNAHLARIAVSPYLQGKGVGTAILTDLLTHFHGQGLPEVSVNTQDTNYASLALYKSNGFSFSGEEYPVYRLI